MPSLAYLVLLKGHFPGFAAKVWCKAVRHGKAVGRSGIGRNIILLTAVFRLGVSEVDIVCNDFGTAALAAVLWHVILSTNVGDDMVYFKTLLDGNSSLGEILAHRYETWSSRMVIEAVLIPLVHCPLLWKILDIVIFTSLPVLLCWV